MIIYIRTTISLNLVKNLKYIYILFFELNILLLFVLILFRYMYYYYRQNYKKILILQLFCCFLKKILRVIKIPVNVFRIALYLGKNTNYTLERTFFKYPSTGFDKIAINWKDTIACYKKKVFHIILTILELINLRL